jgi:uncharacterized peroxidase-related enzyme
VEGHAKDLRAEVDDRELVARIKSDFRSAGLDEPTRTLLEFSEKLTARPAEMTADDADALRSRGFTDRDITDAVHNVGFFSYINRVAQGLGAELEPFMLRGGENVAPGEPL